MSGAAAVRLAEIPRRLQQRGARLIFLSDKGDETIRTLDELYRDTAALTAALQHAGVMPGHRIGILAPNSYAWVVWDLAAIALECVSVALPQERPREALEPAIDRYGLHLIAVDPQWVAQETLAQPHVIDIYADRIAPEKRALPHPAHRHDRRTHSLVFSSGTTGKTKGLIIGAPGTEHLLALYEAAFGVQRDDRLLTFLPFANYQQRMAYYFCLYHGIEFAYVPYPRLFLGLKKYRPSYMIAPPIFYEALQNLALAAAGGAAKTPNVAQRLGELLGGNIRYLITGMAPIKRQTLDFFWNHGMPLYEAFGITEAGMVAWNKPGSVKLGSVGKPAEPGSVGLTEEGEVIITRDALLSLGYFEASEEDARATFVAPNAVATGDIAEFDAEGFLTLVGRKKDAIITKAGEKFHPEAIESLIQRDPRVNLAVVLGGDGLAGVTALIVLQPHDEPADARAQVERHVAQLNSCLPVYQQVKHVIFTRHEFTIENGLRTKNMKLNRKAIRAAFLENRFAAADAAVCETVA